MIDRRATLSFAAILLVGTAAYGCATGAPRPNEPDGAVPQSPSEASGAPQGEPESPQPAGGRPGQFPPGAPEIDPKTPEGITAVVVPAEVKEGEAEYVSADPLPGTENLFGEKEVSLGSLAEAPARVLALLERGLSSSPGNEGVSLVSAGAGRATGLAFSAELSGDLLSFCPLAGGSCTTLRPVDELFGSRSRAENAEITVAYDGHGERFLLLAAVPTTDDTTSKDLVRRIALAVSEKTGPQGGWHVASIWEEDAAGREARLTRLEGLAIAAEGIYVLAETADPSGNRSRRRVWLIDRGEETSGFYAGGTVQVVLYR